MNETITNIRKELNVWLTKIRHAGGTDHMRTLYTDAIAWSETALVGVRRAASTNGLEFSRMADRWGSGLPPSEEPRVLYYPTLASRAANVGGWFALLLEGLIAGSMSIWLFNLPSIWAFIVGVCVCVATAIFIKGLCAPVLLARAEGHPKQAAHWLAVLLLILAPVEFGLLTVAFLVRGATGEFALAIGWAFAGVMGILSVSTPILAALLFTASGLFGWSRRLALQYEDARHLEREIQSLRSACERQLSILFGPQTSSAESHSIAIRLKANTVEGGQSVSGDVQLLNEAPDNGAEISLSSDHAAVQIPSTVTMAAHSKIVSFAGITTPVTEPVTVAIFARAGSSTSVAKLTISPRNGNRMGFALPATLLAVLLCGSSLSQAQQPGRIWIDRTTSVVQEDLDRALRQSGSELPEIAAGRGLSKWEFYRFTDDAWTATPYYSFTIPVLKETPCQSPALSEAERAFKGLYEARKRKAEEDCARSAQREIAQRAEKLEKLFSDARAQLVSVATGGRCTSLIDLFSRIAYDAVSSVNFVLTDGVETCRTLTKIPKPASGSSVFIVLVGTKQGRSSTPGDEFFRRAAILNTYLPWATVIPSWAMTSTGIGRRDKILTVTYIQDAAPPR